MEPLQGRVGEETMEQYLIGHRYCEKEKGKRGNLIGVKVEKAM